MTQSNKTNPMQTKLSFAFSEAVLLVLSLVAAVSLCIAPVGNNAGFLSDVKAVWIQTAFLTAIIFGLAHYSQKHGYQRSAAYFILALFISAFWLMGFAFRQDAVIKSLFKKQFLKSAVVLLGWTWLLYRVFCAAHALLKKHEGEKRKEYEKGRITFLGYFAILLFALLPYLIISYPGNATHGFWWSLQSYYGVTAFTGHVPPIHTLLVGVFVQIGEWLGDGNLGVLLNVLLQMICFALTFSYVFTTMQKMKAPKAVLIVTFLITVLSPYYTDYAVTVLRDTPFSYGCLLMQTEIVCMLRFRKDYFSSRKHFWLYLAGVWMIVFFRKNGVYLVFCMTVILVWIRFGEHRQRKEWKLFGKEMIHLLLPVVSAVVITVCVNIIFNIKPGSKREALSLPFQQTARYLKEYPDEVTEEEKQAIGAILNIDKIASVYNPYLSDPVKKTFKENATTAQLLDYFRVWLKMFFKHPATYIGATVQQNYLLLDINEQNPGIFYSPVFGRADKMLSVTTIHEVDSLSEAKENLVAFWRKLFDLPVIGLFSNIGFYCIIFLFSLVYTVKIKQYKWTVASAPLILTIITTILAPAIKYNPRYMLPVVYGMPLMIAYLLYLNKNRNIQNE